MAEPLRMCVVTRELKPKSELIRLVKINNQIVVDLKQKAQARGVWVSKDPDVIQKMQKTKALNRAFKCDVPASVYVQVEELCQKKN